MRCFTCVLDVSSRFHLHFGYQHVGSENASEDARKKPENPKNCFSILHHALGKNVSQLRFFSRFGTFEVTKTQTHCTV